MLGSGCNGCRCRSHTTRSGSTHVKNQMVNTHLDQMQVLCRGVYVGEGEGCGVCCVRVSNRASSFTPMRQYSRSVHDTWTYTHSHTHPHAYTSPHTTIRTSIHPPNHTPTYLHTHAYIHGVYAAVTHMIRLAQHVLRV
jgi:hypothetical protein